jgi:hypothetical protein
VGGGGEAEGGRRREEGKRRNRRGDRLMEQKVIHSLTQLLIHFWADGWWPKLAVETKTVASYLLMLRTRMAVGGRG